MDNSKVSVIGLGKVGSCLAEVLASAGYEVIGVDTSEKARDSVKVCPTTDDAIKAVLETEISFVIVPTPSKEDGSFNLNFILKVCRQIGEALAKKKTYHLVSVMSTILPKDSELIIGQLEAESGLECGEDFGYCYSPTFIGLGTVLYDLRNPDYYLIGAQDEKAGTILKEVYSEIRENQASIVVTSLLNAEITKIAQNCFLTTKITFANFLTEFCEKTGGDVDIVTNALGRDSRIGPKYLRGGLAYGGPCYPRDNRAIAYSAEKVGASNSLPEMVHGFNLHHTIRTVRVVQENLKPSDKIGFIGLSYRGVTPIVEESSVLPIIRALGVGRAYVWEPLGYEYAKLELEGLVVYCSSLQELLDTCDVYFLTHKESGYEEVRDYLATHGGKTIIDPWRLLRNNKMADGTKYVPFGLKI